MGLNIQTLSDVMRSRGAEDMAMQGQQDQRDMQKLQMMLTLKKLKEEADMKQQTGTMLKDLYRPAQPATAGTMGYGMGMDNQNAQPQLKQLMEQGGDFGMDNASAINSSAEYSNKGAPVPMMAPQAAQAGGIDPMQLAAGFERLAATTGDIEFLSKAQALRSGMQKEGFTLGEGQSRFGGDGRVIANVAKAPKEKDPIDYNKPFLPDGTPNRAYQEFKMRDSRSGASKQTTIVNPALDPFKNEQSLRKEYQDNPFVKAGAEMNNAFNTIKVAYERPSAANDLAMATKYMKILDPTSVVRESEFALAVNATGVMDKVLNYANMIKTGQKLNPNQRKDFYDSAKSINDAFQAETGKVQNTYRGIASQYGLSPDNTTLGPEFKPPKPVGKQQPKPGTVQDGYLFLGGDPSDQSRWKKASK